jgi:hypothetical protein
VVHPERLGIHGKGGIKVRGSPFPPVTSSSYRSTPARTPPFLPPPPHL